MVINIVSDFHRFKIDSFRVPKGFKERPITCSHSIKYYVDHSFSILDSDQRTRLYDFLGKLLEERDDAIRKAIAPYEEQSLLEVCLQDEPSALLTEAYLLQFPTVSFSSMDAFNAAFLEAELHTLTMNGNISTKKISLPNFYDLAKCFQLHGQFLVGVQHRREFQEFHWNPQQQPIWNDQTATLLKGMSFPRRIHGHIEKKAELIQVGVLVAELNGFVLDKDVSDKNKSGQHLRKIFRSAYGTKIAYLSIDFEKASGCFEVHDHKGVHLGETAFVGGPIRNAKSDHSIRV